VSDNGRVIIGESPIRILGIGGSTRQGSKSLTLLQTALRVAEDAGASTTLANVRELALPIFDDDLPREASPPALFQLIDDARAADAYVLCSPTYHGTVSGAVKNALDALNFMGDDDPPYFAGKAVALMALGGGGAANVLTSLHHTARALNGLTIPTVVISGGSAIREGAVTDEMVQRRVGWMIEELLDLAARLRTPAHVTVVAG
jgi:FMN reductase